MVHWGEILRFHPEGAGRHSFAVQAQFLRQGLGGVEGLLQPVRGPLPSARRLQESVEQRPQAKPGVPPGPKVDSRNPSIGPDRVDQRFDRPGTERRQSRSSQWLAA